MLRKGIALFFVLFAFSVGVCVDYSLYGHKETVWEIQTDGKYIYSVGADGMLKIWDSELKLLHSLTTHNSWARCVAVNDKFVVVGGYKPDNTIKIYEKASGRLINTLIGHTSSVFSVVFYKDYIISGGSDNSIIIWKEFKQFKILKIHDGWVRSLYVYKDLLVSGDENGRVNIVSLVNFNVIKSFEVKSQVLTIDAVSTSGALIIGTSDGSIYEIDKNFTLKRLIKLSESVQFLRSLGESVFLSQLGGVLIFNYKEGKLNKKVEMDISPSELTSIAFVDNRFFVSNRQGELFSYTLDGKYISKSPRHFYSAVRLACDEKLLYVGREDGSIEAYERNSGVKKWAVNLSGAVRTVQLYHGEIAATLSNGSVYFIKEGKVSRVLNLKDAGISVTVSNGKNGKLFIGSYEWVYEYFPSVLNRIVHINGAWITSLLFEKDRLFIGTNTGDVYEYLFKDKKLSKLISLGSSVVKLIFKDSMIWIALYNGEIFKLSLTKKSIVEKFKFFQPIYDANFSKNDFIVGGEKLKIAEYETLFEAPVINLCTNDSSVFVGLSNGRIMELQNKRIIRQFAPSIGKVSTIFVDNWAFSGHEDGKIVMWTFDKKSNKFMISKIFDDHLDTVRRIVRIKNRIFSASSDGTVKVWDLESGKLVNTLSGHRGYVWALYHVDDYVISGGWDGRVIVWDGNSYKQVKLYETGLSVTDIWAPSKDEIYTVSLEGYIVKLTNDIKRNKISNDTLWSIDGNNGKIINIYTAGWNGIVHVLDKNLNIQTVKKCHNSTIFKVIYYNDHIITAGSDNLLKVWDKSLNFKGEYDKFRQSILTIAISKSTGDIVTTDGQNLLLVKFSELLNK